MRSKRVKYGRRYLSKAVEIIQCLDAQKREMKMTLRVLLYGVMALQNALQLLAGLWGKPLSLLWGGFYFRAVG